MDFKRGVLERPKNGRSMMSRYSRIGMSVKTATNTSTCSSPFGGARRGIPPYPAPCFFRICVYQPIRISVFTVPLFQKTQNLVRHGVPFSGSLVLNRVLTHVAETLQLFTSMHWGLAHRVGHYVDLWSAALGLTLFPLRYFLECAYGRDAPKPGAGLGSQSSSRASESTITLVRKGGYPEMRVCGNERAHARRAPSRCLRLAECRCRVEYIVGGLLGLGGGGYHHALVATEFGEPALNIRGLVLEDGRRDSRFGAQISG